MARLNPGSQDVKLEGIATPTADNDAATKAYVDDNAGNDVDYENAGYGAIGPLDFNGFSYVEALPVSTEGGIAIDATGVGLTGNILTFRTADVDLTLLQSMSIIQIGYGSPFASGTYVVVEASIVESNSDNIQFTVADGPLDGTDVLATLPAAGDLMTIIVSRAPTLLPLEGLTNVSETAPTDAQLLAYNATNSEWTPVDPADGEAITASGGLQRIEDDISIATGGVTATKLGSSSVSADKIEINAVTATKIAANAVITSRINNDAVTSSKLNSSNDPTNGQILSRSATDSEQFTWIDPADAEAITASGGLTRVDDDISIADGGINEVKLNATNTPTTGQVLTAATDTTQFTWATPDGGAENLNDLADVNTDGVADGFIIRYDGDNSNYRAHSIHDTNRLHGGIDIDIPSDFVIPSATGTEAIAVGYNADASESASIAIGRDSIAAHENSTALGENASTSGNNDVRLGGENSHITIDANLAGTETFENQLASVKYVKDAVSDASRIVTDSVNGIYFGVRENLPDPWGTYEIDPYLPDAVTRQVATSVQFYDYSNENTNTFEAGVFQRVSTTVDQDGGSDLTNNTIPSFFEEQTDVQTDNNIGAVGGEDSTCLGWKYIGYQDAKVWMADPIGVPIQLRWVNHDLNNASVSVPQVGIRLEWVKIKPQTIGNATVYDVSDTDFTTSLAGTTNQYYTHGTTIAPGDTQAHDITFVLPTQQFSDAFTISDDDVLAFRYVIFFHGNEFASDPANNSGLSLDIYWEALGSNNPMFGIETVDVSDQLVMESTGDLRYTDNISGNDLLLIDNVDGVPEVPASTLGLIAGTNITIDGKTINASDAGAIELDDLTDVSDTAPADDQVLTYNSTTSLWEPQASQSGGATTLNGLNDVNITSVADDQILQYNSTTSVFENVALPAAVIPDLGDIGDVNTNGVADGFIIRYDGPNSNYRAHSVGDTNRLYGGIDVDMSSGFTVPAATGSLAVAIGDGATSTHANSTALGQDATTSENNEVRLGDGSAHVTVSTTVAGNESEDNQLVSKRWVNNQISDASRVVSSTANALENLTETTESTPWDNYRIVPGTALVPELQVHMYEFDATESQFIFYPGFLSGAESGNGTNLTTGTIPDFFEEVTDIANEAEVTNAGGTAVTSLGWKYLGHDTATVWQAVSHVYTFDFEWVYPSGNSDGAQNPPDVTSSLELVRLKPLSDNTYNMATNVTVIASSPTSFHNAGTLNPGDTESFTGSYEFAQQELADGLSNVVNGDVFAYRMKVRYKGDGFDGDTNVRLSITESETSNIVPQLGIRHVGRDYSLTLADSGDLQWADHGSVDETNLLLIENTTDGPIIPAATLGLIAGTNITIDGKTINASGGQNLTAGDGIDITSDAISIDFRTETNNPLEVSGVDDAAGLSLNIDEDGPLQKTTNGLDVILEGTGGLGIGSLNSGIQIQRQTNSGIDIDSTGVSIDLPANSGLQLDATGLSLNAGIDELSDVALLTGDDAPADGQVLTFDGTNWQNETPAAQNNYVAGTGIVFSGTDNLTIDTDDSAIVFSDLSGIAVSGVASGDILEFNGTNWVHATPSPGQSLAATLPLEITNDVIALNRGAGLFLDSSNSLAVNPGTGIGVSTADGVFLNSGIGGLNDVNTTSKVPTEGQFLSYDNTDGEWVPVDGISDLSDLSDVSNTAPSNGQALVYNNSTSLWTPAGVGEEYVAINFNSGDSTPDVGLQARAIGIGPDAIVGGIAGMAIGWRPNAGGNLGIAIGERATVGAARGIAIGSSTDSSDSNADLVQAAGEQSIAIGRAARAANTNSLAIGDDTRALTTDTTAIGASAQVTGTATGSTAIGHNATATLPNTTVLGSGSSHTVFAGSNELATISNNSGDITNIECSINNEFFSDGFNPSQTSSEILRYTQVGDLAIGRFDFKIAGSTSTRFLEGDRWAISSSSAPMREAFGYAVGTYGIAIGTFVVAGSAANSAAMGDMWLRPGSTETTISILFRVRSVIGTAPTRDSYISAQFNIAKF